MRTGALGLLVLGFLASLSVQALSEDAVLHRSPQVHDNLDANVLAFFRNRMISMRERVGIAKELDMNEKPDSSRQRRSVNVDKGEDQCHVLQNQDLPGARESIMAAWNGSLTAIMNMTEAFNDVKMCVSWNIFEAIPCALKAVVEVVSSVRTYRPQIAGLWEDIKAATGNTTTNFVGCAKILLAHRTDN